MNLSQSFTQHYMSMEPEMSETTPTPQDNSPDSEKRTTFRFPSKQIEELQRRQRDVQ